MSFLNILSWIFDIQSGPSIKSKAAGRTQAGTAARAAATSGDSLAT
jgi:hypothetical protein